MLIIGETWVGGGWLDEGEHRNCLCFVQFFHKAKAAQEKKSINFFKKERTGKKFSNHSPLKQCTPAGLGLCKTLPWK